MPVSNELSSMFALGITARLMPARDAAIKMGRTPRIERIDPSSANSPIKIVSCNPSSGIAPCADKSESAMGRSKLEPDFGSHAGESETTTLRFGQLSSELTIAARTRSRDSFRAASGNPRSE